MFGALGCFRYNLVQILNLKIVGLMSRGKVLFLVLLFVLFVGSWLFIKWLTVDMSITISLPPLVDCNSNILIPNAQCMVYLHLVDFYGKCRQKTIH